MFTIQSSKRSRSIVAAGLVIGATAVCIAAGFSPENAFALKVQPSQNTSLINSLELDDHLLGEQHLPKIQIAILLDTSSSMQGLIDQTRNQLWSIINEFSTAKRHGRTPVFEVALYEYGNAGISDQKNYVRQLNSFTSELDMVSEGLFSLRTHGGQEYCGAAIKAAVNELQWSKSPHDIKAVFIAGNEGFDQGPVSYKAAMSLAAEKGIVVSTIFAGNAKHVDVKGWRSGAQLAGGDFMNINHNEQIVHIDAPQDERIAALNSQLNDTYLPYGALGRTKAKRQREQDAMNKSISSGLLAKRAQTKSSSYYSNGSWDLVDALDQGALDEEDLSAIEKEQLPEVMQKMSGAERKDYIVKQARERDKVKAEIALLGAERRSYVAALEKTDGAKKSNLGAALSSTVRNQAKAKGFELNESDDVE